MPRLTTPERESYDKFRERQRNRFSTQPTAADLEAEEKAQLMQDALLLGCAPEDVAAVKASYFEKMAAQEAQAEEGAAQMMAEAERDAAKWQGVQSAVEGESDLASYTEEVDLKIDQKTGRYDRGEFNA